MNAYNGKRFYERRGHAAAIEVSYFTKNQWHWHKAQTVNHSDEGMCFQSEVFFKPGATICIRLKNLHPSTGCNCDCRGLRSLTLAETKWCFFNKTDLFYKIGVKYLPPAY